VGIRVGCDVGALDGAAVVGGRSAEWRVLGVAIAGAAMDMGINLLISQIRVGYSASVFVSTYDEKYVQYTPFENAEQVGSLTQHDPHRCCWMKYGWF